MGYGLVFCPVLSFFPFVEILILMNDEGANGEIRSSQNAPRPAPVRLSYIHKYCSLYGRDVMLGCTVAAEGGSEYALWTLSCAL
jgi:hypothetical protein